MAEKKIVVRYSLQDKEVVERAFKSLGDEGEKFLKRLERAGKPAGDSLKLVDTASREAQDALRGLAEHSGRVGTVLESLGPKGLAAAAAVGAVAFAVRDGLRAYAEDERAQLRFQAVLKATGNAAGVTTAQVAELAERLERTTFFKKDDILQAAAALAAFKTVTGDAFESTIKLAADMSEVFGGDVATNARLLGRALQDPAHGAELLKRKMGELSPELEAAADKLIATGHSAEAAQLLIDALSERMGGAAQAAAGGLAGKVDDLGDSFDDLLKSIGHLVAESGLPGFLEGIAHRIDAITAAIEHVKDFKARLDDPLAQARFNLETTNRLAAAGQLTNPRAAQLRAADELAQLVDRDARASFNQSVAATAARNALKASQSAAAAGGSGGGSGGRAPTAADKHALDDYLQSLAEENRLIRLNARDRAVEEAVLKAGNAARRDGKQLTDDQRREVAGTAAAMYDYADAQKAAEEQGRKLAEQQRDMLRPLEHALDNVQDGFADVLAGGEFTARSLVDIFRRAGAEIAAALVFRPIISGVTGALTGVGAGGTAGSALAGGGGFNTLSGLSSLGSGLFKGFTTPVLNPGIAFDIGGRLGLGAGPVGALHTALGNFTPLAGLAGLGGGLLSSALFGGGGYSSAGSTLGGIAGTALGGPVGAFAGSLLGGALGGLFGGGQPHPAASFEGGVSAGGALSNVGYRSKNMSDDGARALADTVSGFLAGLAGLGNLKFAAGNNVQGAFTTAGAFLNVPGHVAAAFNPADAASTAAALKQVAVYLARTADVVDNDLLQSLEMVSTQGRDASAVLAAVAGRMQLIAGVKSIRDNLDAAAGLSSPERARQQAFDQLDALLAQRFARPLSPDEVNAAVQAALAASRGYYGTAPGYAADVAGVRARLDQTLAAVPSFAAGGDTPAGLFRMHPDEILVTSPTPGRVLSARETRQALGGGDLMLYRGLAELREQVAAMVAEQRRATGLLARAAAA